MGRIIRRLPSRQMALGVSAIRWRNIQTVVVVDVAGSARGRLSGRHKLVRVRQREACGCVIKHRSRPRSRVVARGTHRSRESCSDVIRHTSAERWGALPGRLMATVTIRVCRCERIVVADVAIGTHYDLACGLQLVRTGKRPAGRAVIKCGGVPSNRVVAGRAVSRREGRTGRWVHRVVGLLPGRQMATGIAAVRRSDLKIVVVVDVAGSAAGHLATIGDKRVGIGQRKAERGVIKLAVRPFGDGMAR